MGQANSSLGTPIRVTDISQKDRIVGTIYGQCIGDAIGLLTEFMTKREAKVVRCFCNFLNFKYFASTFTSTQCPITHNQAHTTHTGDLGAIQRSNYLRLAG